MSRSKRRPIEVAREAVASVPGATVSAVAAEPAPILLVASFPDNFVCPDHQTLLRIKQSIEDAFGGQPHPPVIVLAPGLKLEAVLDPRGRV